MVGVKHKTPAIFPCLFINGHRRSLFGAICFLFSLLLLQVMNGRKFGSRAHHNKTSQKQNKKPRKTTKNRRVHSPLSVCVGRRHTPDGSTTNNTLNASAS